MYSYLQCFERLIDAMVSYVDNAIPQEASAQVWDEKLVVVKMSLV